MKNFPTLLLLILLCGNLLFSQNDTKEKIGDAIAGYFELDRETIHVHFDKSVFFTNEDIFFKGYCFNKKQGTPFFETTNVFAILYDSNGKLIREQLLFAYIGAFSGNFKLGTALASGRYYVQFYTNWMNNFPEDESAVFPIDIINENEQVVTQYDSPDYSKVNISFHPEGGHFVDGVPNNLGIRVTDCDGKPIEVRDGKITDANGETITNFSIGKTGCGKVLLTPGKTPLKATIEVAAQTLEAILPAAGKGIAVNVNNYALAGKTLIKLRCDEKTRADYSNKPLFVVIQQNNKSTIFETALKSGETELVVSNENFHPGVNAIRVIDQNLNELAERLVCEIPNNSQEFSFSQSKTADGIKIVGHSNFPNADISISVLPEASQAAVNNLSGAFLIDPYLKEKLPNGNYFLDNPTKAKRFELDLFLISQKGKYEWRNIVREPAKPTYDFDIGLTIKGTTNQTLADPKKYRMRLSSPSSMIDDYAEIDAKNEFIYKNLVFANVSNFKFTLLKNPSVATDAKIFHQVYNRKRPFNKPFIAQPLPCSPGKRVPLDLPHFANDVVALDNIELIGKTKSDLTYKNKFGNSGLRGHKITDENSRVDLLSFIRANGFDVLLLDGRVTITGRLRTSVNAQQSTPEVWINSRRLMNYDELQDIQMFEVDEIYMNPHAIVPSINNNIGVIKIYMKKIGSGDVKSVAKSVEIKEGFAPLPKFEPPMYLSTSDIGFEKYGIVDWIQTILTDANGDFVIQIPKTDAKTVTLHIQGFTPEGKMISIAKTISLQ